MVLARGPAYSSDIRAVVGVVDVGALTALLSRAERAGLVSSTMSGSKGRARRLYSITEHGLARHAGVPVIR